MSGQQLRAGARGRVTNKAGRPKGRQWPHAVRCDLSTEQKRKLQQLALEHGIGVSAMLRRLVDQAPKPNR